MEIDYLDLINRKCEKLSKMYQHRVYISIYSDGSGSFGYNYVDGYEDILIFENVNTLKNILIEINKEK